MDNWIIAIIVFLYGLIIGSFLNVVIYRLPLGISFVGGRSHCPHCKRQLTARDLVPLFSFLRSRAKCRYCKEPISLRYPLVEVLNGLAYLALYYFKGLSLSALCDAVLLSALIVVALIDYDTHKIPNRLNAFIALLALLRLALDFNEIALRVPGTIAVLLFGALLIGLSLLTGRNLFGMGDIKLLLALSLYFDYRALMIVFILTFLAAGLYALVVLLCNGMTAGKRLPMGPYFAIAVLVVVLYGDKLRLI